MIAAGKCRNDIAKLEVDSYNQSSFRKLANIANLSIADEEFINNVNCDIESFLKQRHSNGVLLFPPVNNFRRFLIHQTCESFRNKYDLYTFSVGQGPFRRTVVCFKNQLLDPHKYSDTAAAANFDIRHKHTTSTTLKSWRSDNRRIEATYFPIKYTATTTNKREFRMRVDKSIVENKINKSTSGELYRPPALRNLDSEMLRRYEAEPEELITYRNSKNMESKEATCTSSPGAANGSITTTTSISCNNSPIHRNENVIINNCTTSTQQNSACQSQQQQQQVDEQQKQPQRQQQTRRERRPDRAVYIPRARRSQTTPPNTTTTTETQIKTQPPAQQQQSTQLLPVLAPTTIDETSKSLNKQLAVTLDDTTTASVHHKPSSKAVETGGKVYSGVFIVDTTSTCCNNTTTAINKKEKLNKESREQRREKRMQKKLSTISTQRNHIHKNNEKLYESSINTISNNDNNDDDDEIANQALIDNVQQVQSSLSNNVNNFNELINNDNINNLPKGFNCDSSDEYILNTEPTLSVNATAQAKQQNCEVESLIINPVNEAEFLNSISNTSNSQFLCQPAHSIEFNCKTTANSTSNVTISDTNTNTNTMPKPSKKLKSHKANSEVHNGTKLPNLRIEDVASPTTTKCDVEEQELQRASQEINRSNRRIIKQTFISDVLQIPDHVNEDKSDVAEDNNESVVTKEPHITSQIDSFTEDEEDEDDWESMFDDSGDCLDPKIIQELTASVGKCKIELPKMDYSAFLTKQSILNEEEFPHVLEVSNFPVEFKNQDLLMVFSQYKESGFDIKWVDDTHALAVFSSSRIAAEVLTMGHPFVVLKPLAEATVESRLKAKKCAASLQPYRPRPETCAALARRLVTGALGVRLKTAAAERENEKRVLREAKERKLLAAKQRDEVWDS